MQWRHGEWAVWSSTERRRAHRADRVISSLDPHRTFLGLVGDRAPRRRSSRPTDSPLQDARQLGQGEPRARQALPEFKSSALATGPSPARRHRDLAPASTTSSAPTITRSTATSRSARTSNVVIPSVVDPTVAPPGQARRVDLRPVRALQHQGGRRALARERREAFGDAVVDTLAEYCPGLKESILHRQVLTPWDLEQEFGLTEGNIFHGELSLEQLALPAPGRLAGRATRRR